MAVRAVAPAVAAAGERAGGAPELRSTTSGDVEQLTAALKKVSVAEPAKALAKVAAGSAGGFQAPPQVVYMTASLDGAYKSLGLVHREKFSVAAEAYRAAGFGKGNSGCSFTTIVQCVAHWLSCVAADEKAQSLRDSGAPPRCLKYIETYLEDFGETGKSHVRTAMKIAVEAKFVPSDGPRDDLLETGEAELVFVAKDRLFGVGYGATVEAVGKRAQWGENLLGMELMRVRKLARTAKKEDDADGEEGG